MYNSGSQRALTTLNLNSIADQFYISGKGDLQNGKVYFCYNYEQAVNANGRYPTWRKLAGVTDIYGWDYGFWNGDGSG